MASIAQSSPVSNRSLAWLWEWLTEELAAYPGRALLVARMVTAATVVIVGLMLALADPMLRFLWIAGGFFGGFWAGSHSFHQPPAGSVMVHPDRCANGLRPRAVGFPPVDGFISLLTLGAGLLSAAM